MKKLLKALALLAFLLVFGVVGLVLLVFMTEHKPADTEPVAVDCAGVEAPLRPGDRFTVLVWNLQFAGSRKHQFFYDGGEAVHVPPEDVAETIEAVRTVLVQVKPDLALLQEVDRDAARTGREDQLPPYIEAMDARCAAAATYHKSPYVPSPSHRPMGRVHMDLATLSKAPLLRASRVQLAMLDEHRLVQAFNLKRALLQGEVKTEGLAHPLAVGNTHLSAFSYGDGTLGKQVATLADWMRRRPEGQPWILGGDFNLLPTGDDPGRLTAEGHLYADADNPIEPLLAGFSEVASDPLAPEARTYLPFGASEPDRKIDYLFYGGPLRLVETEVIRSAAHISDHLPIRAVFEVVDPSAPPEAEVQPEDGAATPEEAEAPAPTDGAAP